MALQERQDRLAAIFGKMLICLDDFDLRYLNRLTASLAVDVINRVDHSSSPVIITTDYTLEEVLKSPENDLEEKLFRIILRKTAPSALTGVSLLARFSSDIWPSCRKRCKQ